MSVFRYVKNVTVPKIYCVNQNRYSVIAMKYSKPMIHVKYVPI